MSTSDAFVKWLDSTDPIEEPTAEQIGWARQVLSHEGMRVIWGMMIGEAQAKRILLENATLATPQDANRAALIQGGIKGIYVLRDTLIELVEMGSKPAAPEQEI